jgi:hypothetical protein
MYAGKVVGQIVNRFQLAVLVVELAEVGVGGARSRAPCRNNNHTVRVYV